MIKETADLLKIKKNSKAFRDLSAEQVKEWFAENAKATAKQTKEKRRYMKLARKFLALYNENKRSWELTKEYIKNLSQDSCFKMYGYDKPTVLEAMDYQPKKKKQ